MPRIDEATTLEQLDELLRDLRCSIHAAPTGNGGYTVMASGRGVTRVATSTTLATSIDMAIAVWRAAAAAFTPPQILDEEV